MEIFRKGEGGFGQFQNFEAHFYASKFKESLMKQTRYDIIQKLFGEVFLFRVYQNTYLHTKHEA